MNIVNEQISHKLYGDGKVISQEANIIFVQFSEQDGLKKFLYPDAFKNYLKLYNPDIEAPVLEELRDKQAQIEAEELKKQQDYEDSVKRMELERLKLKTKKKKTSRKKEVIIAESISDLPVEKSEESNE